MKRFFFAVLCCANTLFAQEMTIRGGLMGGEYSPDIEKKFRNDVVFGALIGGGLGFDSPWANKSSGGLNVGVQYRPRPAWLVEAETNFIASEPNYSTFQTVSGTTSGVAFSINQFTQTQVELSRAASSLLGGYAIVRGAPGHEITALGGLRVLSIHAAYDTFTLGSITLGSSVFPTLGKSLEATTSASGTGPEFGAEYAYNFDFGGRVAFRGLLYSTAGRWTYKRITVSANTASGSGLWREEDGRYHVTGRIAAIEYSHPVAERVRVFVNLSSEKAETRDLRVKLFRLPVPVASTDFSNLLVDTALTYPGSHSRDSVFGFTVGVQGKLL